MKIATRFLFGLTALSIIGCVGHPPYYERCLRAEKDGLIQAVRYGYRDDALLFVVFESSYTGLRQIGFQDIPSDRELILDRWIDLPDTTRKDLPTSKMLFEYRTGAFANRPVDVTLGELKGFLASKPKTYSIEALEEYVALERKRT